MTTPFTPKQARDYISQFRMDGVPVSYFTIDDDGTTIFTNKMTDDEALQVAEALIDFDFNLQEERERKFNFAETRSKLDRT